VGPKQNGKRQEGADEERHCHNEWQAIVTPAHAEEDASHSQHGEAREHKTRATILQIGPDPRMIYKHSAECHGQHDQHPGC
jgi:hypothetical protein